MPGIAQIRFALPQPAPAPLPSLVPLKTRSPLEFRGRTADRYEPVGSHPLAQAVRHPTGIPELLTPDNPAVIAENALGRA
jgi:hypothetical protein